MLSINSIKKITINEKLCQKSAFQPLRLHPVHLQDVVLTLPASVLYSPGAEPQKSALLLIAPTTT